MVLKKIIEELEKDIKGYKERLDFLENPETDIDDTMTKSEEEFYSEGTTTVYDFYYYYWLDRIREYIGEVIEKLVENDRRYDNYTLWYFDLEYKPELIKELMEKILNASEKIFDDEVLKVVFKIILWNTQNRKKHNYDYEDVYFFEDDVMTEFFYLAIKKNQELIKEFEKEEQKYISYRQHNKAEWEKLL